MDATPSAAREIVVPATVLTTLRRELSKEAGALPTIHALHAAGYATGRDAAPGLTGSESNRVATLPQGAFWTRLQTYLTKRGWGTLEHRARHPAVGFLHSLDWVESAVEVSDEASCSFTCGFLSGLLSEVAGGAVAVLEVVCRGRGDEECAFAFGTEAAIHALYTRLADGDPLEEALKAL